MNSLNVWSIITKCSASLKTLFILTQAIELKQSQKEGFVHFRKRVDDMSLRKENNAPKVPQHLIPKYTKPMQLSADAKPAPVKTHEDLNKEASRLQEELAKNKALLEAKLREQKERSEAHKKANNEETRKLLPPPPPPPLSFTTNTKKRRMERR